MKYECFHLVLMVTHACNLRCDYCYTGRKLNRSMSREVAQAALRRVVSSIRSGGTLELGFFGGEPLLAAEFIAETLDDARQAAGTAGIRLRPGITTNGTVRSPSAWKVMTMPDVDLCISHDGLPEIHDRHRRMNDRGSAAEVLDTIQKLFRAGREVRVVTVVQPNSAALLPESIGWLYGRGIRRIDLTLDVWAKWQRQDIDQLEGALRRVADIWQAGLPNAGINWFDEKAGYLLGLPTESTARCRFGDGEIAVSPAGNLYPCERLIGEDNADHTLRLPGHVLQGEDFCREPFPERSTTACSRCAIQSQCNTACRCNNYVRTGDISRPDALLCLLDRVCYRETARVLRKLQPACETSCAR